MFQAYDTYIWRRIRHINSYKIAVYRIEILIMYVEFTKNNSLLYWLWIDPQFSTFTSDKDLRDEFTYILNTLNKGLKLQLNRLFIVSMIMVTPPIILLVDTYPPEVDEEISHWKLRYNSDVSNRCRSPKGNTFAASVNQKWNAQWQSYFLPKHDIYIRSFFR